MNSADLIAHILTQEGVEMIPAFPHSDIIEAAAKLGLRPIIVRQERQALHITDGYVRVTGARKLCCTTVQYGSRSENAMARWPLAPFTSNRIDRRPVAVG